MGVVIHFSCSAGDLVKAISPLVTILAYGFGSAGGGCQTVVQQFLKAVFGGSEVSAILLTKFSFFRLCLFHFPSLTSKTTQYLFCAHTSSPVASPFCLGEQWMAWLARHLICPILFVGKPITMQIAASLLWSIHFHFCTILIAFNWVIIAHSIDCPPCSQLRRLRADDDSPSTTSAKMMRRAAGLLHHRCSHDRKYTDFRSIIEKQGQKDMKWDESCR